MRYFAAILLTSFLWADVSLGQPIPVKARRAAILRRAENGARLRHLSRIRHGYADDCSGFVRWSYSAAGVELFPLSSRHGENGVKAIYRKAAAVGALHWKKPRPGDLVFFRETYDRNRDGRRNDGLTHVGIVESVAPNGTVTYVHRAGSGIVRSRMNLNRPRLHRHKGVLLNDFARRKEQGRRGYLAGELFAAYASAAALRE